MESVHRRITSVDSLRAVSLFGIILVHMALRYGYVGTLNPIHGNIDFVIYDTIMKLLEGKCRLIFNILFGVSFYLMMSRPNYDSKKFVWRCILLMGFGLLNRIFYPAEILTLYGFLGIFLVLIKTIPHRFYIAIIVFLYLLQWLFSFYRIGDLLNAYIVPVDRFSCMNSFGEFSNWYKVSFIDYAQERLNLDFITTLANFIIGYYLGLKGFVSSMDKCVNIKWVTYSFLVFIFMFYFSKYGFIHTSKISFIAKQMFNLSGACFYSLIYVFLYNKFTCFSKLFSSLEKYGRLGLTNYTFQNIMCVTILFYFGLVNIDYSMTEFILISVAVYIAQLVFSCLWLSLYKYGPLEYIWRCGTECRWIKLVK